MSSSLSSRQWAGLSRSPSTRAGFSKCEKISAMCLILSTGAAKGGYRGHIDGNYLARPPSATESAQPAGLASQWAESYTMNGMHSHGACCCITSLGNCLARSCTACRIGEQRRSSYTHPGSELIRRKIPASLVVHWGLSMLRRFHAGHASASLRSAPLR